MCTQSSISWESVAAVIGAAAWLPTIWAAFKKTKIKGKILGQYANLSVIENRSESVIVQKLSLLSINDSFNLKDIEICVLISGSTSEIKCKNWTWRNLQFVFNENGRDVRKELKISSIQWLAHLCMLPKDQAVVGYLSFSLPMNQDVPFEYVKYIFSDFNDKKIELKILKSETPDSTQHFDDQIWQ